MERPRWDRIQEIYYSTLSVGESERRTFIDSQCDSDSVLVEEVSSLLEAEKSNGDFLNAPIFELGLKVINGNAKHSAESYLDELIGTIVEKRYRIEKELGRGGIGAVYLGRDLRLHNRKVAVKVLLPESLQAPYLVKRFKQEAEALSRIDHPGVVHVLTADELADGKLYIVMQYVEGVNLSSQISNEGMDFERAASILKQVGSALDYVHEKGICHRDLKPENIMLQTLTRGSEFVKIVDFGIAKVQGSVVAPSTINEAPIGTVIYMSPEQLRGERASAASDIFSMALVAFEMLTGRRPFNPGTAPQLLELQRAGVRVMPADLRPGLSTQAQAVILRGLSFESEDRYQTAGSFGDALAAALIAEPNKSHIRKSKRASKWPLVIAASLLLVIAVATLAGFYILRPKLGAEQVSKSVRSFSYWLTVQKVRDGRNYQEPFQSSGAEVFQNGNKFRINVSSTETGYLYVLQEGLPEADGATLTMLYPTPSSSNAFVSSQPVHTNWNRFRGQPGTVSVWIIWSTSLVSELETAKNEAFENEKAVLANANSIRAVRELLTKYSESKPDSIKERSAPMIQVRGAGDVLVTLLLLEHK